MDPGSKVSFTFVGTGIRWIGFRDQWSGNARVTIDGALAATVDTYSDPQKAKQVLFNKTGLRAGTHKIVIEALGTQGAQSGGAWVWIDAFEVTS
jgi:hypothetical protein